jgi:farnesyl diphosphate synthase
LTETTSEGNILRGRTVLDTAWILNGYTLTERQIEDLITLGCLTELFNATYCVWDDIMDGSETRRNKPCWDHREGVVLTAIYVVLKERFRDHPTYQDFVELFTEASLHTGKGQLLDTMASTHALKVKQFTWDRYEYNVENKTSNYTLYVPMALPLLYLGIASPKRLSEVYKAAMTLGLIFQARDDFFSIFMVTLEPRGILGWIFRKLNAAGFL